MRFDLLTVPTDTNFYKTTYPCPSRCLMGVFDVAGVGFALFSSLDVDSEDTDAKSSFKNQTQKHHEFVDIGKRELYLYMYMFIIYTTMFI